MIRTHPECPEVFNKLSINWDGTLTACCTDSDNKMLLGNIKESSVTEIWKSDKLDEYHTAVGFICDAVGYMKECGVEEDDLVGHVRAAYEHHISEDELVARDKNIKKSIISYLGNTLIVIKDMECLTFDEGEKRNTKLGH